MLTLQQKDHELKIKWRFDNNISEDLAEFLKINAIEKESALESCSFFILGENAVPTLVWKALLSSLAVLLNLKIKLHFICSSEKMEAQLRHFGFFLLGEVTLDPTITF